MAPKQKDTGRLADLSPEYHFGGPLGTGLISIGLPILLYTFTFACNDVTGCPAPSLLHPKSLSLDVLKREVGWPEDGIWGLGSWRATGWTLAYYLFSAILYRVLPAQEVEGPPLTNGKRLRYRFNAFSSSVVTLVLCLAGTLAQGAEFPVWTFITDNFLEILTANILISFVLATYHYVRSFEVKAGSSGLRTLAAGGHSGNLVYDWFIGRELNPRVTLPLLGEIDVKEFMEIRPGLLGWALVNFAFIAKQYRTYGFVTDSIVFVSVIQTIYILDGQYMESAILTTIDIATDGFGFMLSFGDLVWVPFLYSTQARYLSVYPITLGWSLVVIGAVLLIGFSIFRLSNSEKNNFRTNPKSPAVAHLKSIETKAGTRLLVSGWWGRARHINYMGDWIQSWPYCLSTGWAGYTILTAGTRAPGAFTMADGREVVQGAASGWGMLFTYFYILYFTVLLVHRAWRDDEKCARKYGADWEKYKSIVRWRIIPGIY